MTVTIHSDPVPLRQEENGTIRVGKTRVTLDIVIESFKRGNAAEIIAHKFPTLDLADVYAVIAYYLRHKDDIEAYLSQRDIEAEELRKKIEANQPPRAEVKARLLARKAQMEQSHASPGS